MGTLRRRAVGPRRSMEVDFVKGAKHCALDDCKLRDFLPYECALCKRTFCTDHWRPAAHRCPVPPPSNETVFCPICKAQVLVRYSEGDNPQQKLAEHAMSNCRKNTASFEPRFACHADGCRKKSDAQFLCSICEEQFCLKHRAPDAHACKGPPEKSFCTIS